MRSMFLIFRWMKSLHASKLGMKKKITHISVARDLGSGPLQQITYEKEAATSIQRLEWEIVAYQDVISGNSSISRTPWMFRAIFLRNIFFWFLVIKHSRSSSFVLTRHITFDPFAVFFAPLVNNRISIHHSKEIEELKLIREDFRGRLASHLERISGRVAARHAFALASVTREIADYQSKLHSIPQERCLVFPNGIAESAAKLVGDNRVAGTINAVFIATRFVSWHGLDLLFSLEDTECHRVERFPIFIHVIGEISSEQSRIIKEKSGGRVKFVVHGALRKDQYREIFSLCDFGFDALAICRKGLNEACTLKTREMLASGIPVLSTAKDSSLPIDFKHYMVAPNIDIKTLIDFGLKMKHTSRESVRDSAMQYINKRTIMERLSFQLEEL